VLYDVGCDYGKLADPGLRKRYYGAGGFPFGPPIMHDESRLPVLLARLGIGPRDVDAIVLGHLHFDHAGGLRDFEGAEIHCHADEWEAARDNTDGAYFADDFAGNHRWRFDREEKSLCAGLRVVDSPGHTAGHRSLVIELPSGPPIILAGDAADLQRNIDDEIAPGLLRRLKALAADERAELWPNHDIDHWRRLRQRGWPVLAARFRSPPASPEPPLRRW
jgi:N-acyl homoserine lactone hydrolase